jgi:hypothetical protein
MRRCLRNARRVRFDVRVDILPTLFGDLRRCFESFPDPRRGQPNSVYSMADIGLAAFSIFFTQSPSFLAFQRALEEGHGRSNCQSLFEMPRIPSDNHIRAMLDPAKPELLHLAFATMVEALQRPGGLDEFRRLGGHTLIALDGTEYHCSDKIHCEQCSKRLRSKGTTEYFHAMLSATLVAPGHNHAIPLEPEFITPQDGVEKQDCESRAARRWLTAHAAGHAALNPIYLGDDLYANQPLCQAALDQGAHFIFVCKPTSHPLIGEYISGADLPSHVVRVKNGRRWDQHHYRWINKVPLRDSKDALDVNWFEVTIQNADGKITYRNSFVTDLPVDRDNVAEMAACGRARWKIENETFNVLKTKGYNLEHNFGHGKQNLAAILATLNLLAFAYHTVCDHLEPLWRLARSKASSRAQFFHRIVTLTTYLIFPSWDDLLQTLAFLQPPPQPP